VQKITFHKKSSITTPSPCLQAFKSAANGKATLHTVLQRKLLEFKKRILVPAAKRKRKNLMQHPGLIKEGLLPQLQNPGSSHGGQPEITSFYCCCYSFKSTASQGSSSRARAMQSPQVLAARSTYSAQASQGISIANHVSPSAVVQMPVAFPQMHPPLPIQVMQAQDSHLLPILWLQSLPKIG